LPFVSINCLHLGHRTRRFIYVVKDIIYCINMLVSVCDT
jgi:hypothetical protein